MRSKSHIEWTESTWNPVTGCSKVSAGCKNCYAERMARRLRAMGNSRYSAGFDVTLHFDLIETPKAWKAPRLIFVNSMSDLFHERVPLNFIKKVFATMRLCPQHTFQILTKRSSRLANLTDQLYWAPNIWIGVSVEHGCVMHRIFDLLKVPAAVRFLSCEPLIGPCENMPLEGIDWVIVGGESGPGSRSMQIDWVRSIHRQCRASGSAFFFKQWGGVRKDLTGRELKGRTYDEMPIPKCPEERRVELGIAQNDS
jgi:protein gp37